MSRLQPLAALCFDLDGTLADTGPDLLAALNAVRADLGLPATGLATIRPALSQGGLAILRSGIPETDAWEQHLPRFLDAYRDRICVHTRWFDGIPQLLDRLAQQGLPWAVVTNKSSALTQPLLAAMRPVHPPVCVVCGDTTPYRKPHPEPMWHACRQLGVDPARTVLVGDDERDVQSAYAAGAGAVLALWGYGSAQVRASDWPGLYVATDPDGVLPALGLD